MAFGSTPLNGSPFGTTLGDLQNTWAQQYMATQQMQQAQRTSNILDEVNKEVASLATDEQNALAVTQEYQMAKQAYEAGFMSFIGLKFSQEYTGTPEGKLAAENLLGTIRRSKDVIRSQVKAKEDKVNALLDLVESDPEMKKRFDELMTNKVSKQ